MIRPKKHRSYTAEDIALDMTPMIDITFILLIFFVITANVAQHVFSVNVPDADKSYSNQKDESEAIKITIFENGTYAIGDEKLKSVSALKSQILDIKKTYGKIDVLVISDGNANVQNMVEILTFLRGNSIKNVDLLVEKS